jgi:hypothetical protein
MNAHHPSICDSQPGRISYNSGNIESLEFKSQRLDLMKLCCNSTLIASVPRHLPVLQCPMLACSDEVDEA